MSLYAVVNMLSHGGHLVSNASGKKKEIKKKKSILEN